MKWWRYSGLFLLGLSACSSSESPQGPGDVIAQSLASSVQLFAERVDGKRRAGSGVVLSLDQDGSALILTAAHMLEPLVDQTIFVQAPDNSLRVEAEIVKIDAELDVAVLQASGLGVAPARLKGSARLGDNVWVVSFPWGRRGTVVNGFVSQIAGEDDATLLPIEGPVGLIDAAVSYGTSGGGVFDGRTGQLIGIVRGYRTARLPLPGPQAASLELPIAGETTVIPTAQILCVLRGADLDRHIESNAGTAVHEPSCNRTRKFGRAQARPRPPV